MKTYKAYYLAGYVHIDLAEMRSRDIIEWLAYLANGYVQEYDNGILINTYNPGRW